MKELEIQNKTLKSEPLDFDVHFDVTKHIRLVPHFKKKNLTNIFSILKKVIDNLKSPKEHWTLLLQNVLIGEAREIYTQLTIDQSFRYDTVRKLIRNAYELDS